MLIFPLATKVNRFLSKENIYKNIQNLSTALKDKFITEIEKIIITHTLSIDTLKINSKIYTEILFLEILLKRNISDKDLLEILEVIDQSIPYPVLFIVKNNSQTLEKVYLSYKEIEQGKVNILKTFNNSWQENNNLILNGNTIDEIYFNFLYQLSAELLKYKNKLAIREAIVKILNKEKLVKEIITLENKQKRELSMSKKQELAKERLKLVQILESDF